MMTTDSIDFAVPSVTTAESPALSAVPLAEPSLEAPLAALPQVDLPQVNVGPQSLPVETERVPFVCTLTENAHLQQALEAIVVGLDQTEAIAGPAVGVTGSSNPPYQPTVVSTPSVETWPETAPVNLEVSGVIANPVVGAAGSSNPPYRPSGIAQEGRDVGRAASMRPPQERQTEVAVVPDTPLSQPATPGPTVTTLGEPTVTTLAEPTVTSMPATPQPVTARAEADRPTQPTAAPTSTPSVEAWPETAPVNLEVSGIIANPVVEAADSSTLPYRPSGIAQEGRDVGRAASMRLPQERQTEVAVVPDIPLSQPTTSSAVIEANVIVPVAVPTEPSAVAVSESRMVPVTAVEVVRAAYAPDPVMAPQTVWDAEVFVQAANAVADTLLVTPGLLRGQGEIRIQLKPDVLDGTEIKIAVTGRNIEVKFMPLTQEMSVLIEKCRPQLEQHLSERVHAFQIAVDVRPQLAAARRMTRREEEV